MELNVKHLVSRYGRAQAFLDILPSTTVIAKYAGHVRQTSDDVRQRGQTLPDILSRRVQYALYVRQGKEKWLLIFASHQLEKCLTGAQNVRQGDEGLPDILSGTPEIIFAITGTSEI